MTKKDELVDCLLCGEKSACYKLPISDTSNASAYVCLGCGFASNDLMIEGNFDMEVYELELPELYKEIKRVDSEGRVWYPNIVTIPDNGVVFVSGLSTVVWEW